MQSKLSDLINKLSEVYKRKKKQSMYGKKKKKNQNAILSNLKAID